MKEIKIQSITMHYFKGMVNETVVLSSGRTVISGRNGSGKSTVADAFAWCMWGKNAQGTEKFGLKTVDAEGREIEHVDHEVVVTLTVNGELQTFSRNLQPKYDKNDVLKGNDVAYAWNGVPMKKSEYDQKVKEVFDETVFGLISSPTAFMEKKVEERRAILMRAAGDISDREVLEEMEKSMPEEERGSLEGMLRLLEGKTTEMLKKLIDAQLRPINETLQLLPARIDENRRMTPERPDVDALMEQKEETLKRIESIQKAMNDAAEAALVRNEEHTALAQKLADIERKQHEVLDAAQRAERAEIHKANQAYEKAKADVEMLEADEKNELQQLNQFVNQTNANIEYYNKQADALSEEMTKLREEWQRVKGQQWTWSDVLVCPMYGHRCMDVDACAKFHSGAQSAMDAFENQKNEKLREIAENGKRLKGLVDGLIKDNEQRQEELIDKRDKYRSHHDKRELMLTMHRLTMANNPKRPLIAQVKGEDLPEWVKLQEEAVTLAEQLSHVSYVVTDTTTEREEYVRLNQELKRIEQQLAVMSQIETCEKRVNELEEQLKSQGKMKAKLEMQKQMVKDFEQARMAMVSERVNKLFKLARWQMWSKQVNGEYKDDCVCLCNGVKWQDANTATKINVGIDIAATLGELVAKCKVPMIIDNGESVTDIYDPGVQQVILRVDATKENLTVTQG